MLGASPMAAARSLLPCVRVLFAPPFLTRRCLDTSQLPSSIDPTTAPIEPPTVSADSIPTSNETSPQRTLNPTDVPRKKRSFLNIPSRSSSNTKQESTSTQPSENNDTMVNALENPGQGPRRKSLLSRPRSGSQASSRKSSRVRKEAEATRLPIPTIPQADGAADRVE